jgi:raffinose/stachyose/melibiose transport system substrate-binding protein
MLRPFTCDDAYIERLFLHHLYRLVGPDGVKDISTNNKWDDPAVLKAFQAYDDMVKKGYFSKNTAANKWPAGQQEIAMGEVSMYLNGSYLVNEVMPTTGEAFQWGQFAYPVLDSAKSDATNIVLGSQLMGINKNCKSPEAAFAFCVFITTGKWDKELAQKTYGVPMGGTTDWPVQLSDAKALFENAKTRILLDILPTTNSAKAPVVKQVFTQVIGQTMTPEQAVAELKK